MMQDTPQEETEEENPQLHNWFCYLLVLTDEKGVAVPRNIKRRKGTAPARTTKSEGVYETYIGATDDLRHRLRAHNGVVDGGALSTHIRSRAGCVWRFVLYLSCFTKKEALSLEKAMQNKGTSRRNKAVSLEKRRDIAAATKVRALQGVYEALNMLKWSSKMPPVSTLQLPFHIHWCAHEHRPENSAALLPEHIMEERLSQEEQKQWLADRPTERNHWVVLPYNN